MNYSRKDFIKLSALGISAIPLLGFDTPLSALRDKKADTLNVHLFSKHLQFLDYNDMSEAAAEMGFNGLDLTVRPKGHVLPERVAEDLPKAVTSMKSHGLSPLMMTTEVTDAKDPRQELVLKTASDLGVKYYRMGWLTYPKETSISDSTQSYAKQFSELEALNEKLGLHGGYQNHAGNHVGAPIWDLHPILEGKNPDFIGCQYDIRHAVVEGGNCWELGLRRIRPFIKSIVIKDFKWGQVDGKWRPVNVPLGEGMVDFDGYFKILKKYNINPPISLHLEYDLGGAEHGANKIDIPQKEVFARMKKDLEYLKLAWSKA